AKGVSDPHSESSRHAIGDCSGFIDLHCHYLPAVNDGVRTTEDGVRLCSELRSLGYGFVVATPHIRSGMFENRKENLEPAFATFREGLLAMEGMPKIGLGAEHFLDDLFWELFADGRAMLHPQAKSVLVEFPPDTIPRAAADWFF